MSNIWFFGDSFCAYDRNWVSYVKNHYEYDHISNLGKDGTSLQFLVKDLLNKKENIREDDGVVICMTDINRDMFKDKNYMTTFLEGEHPMISPNSPNEKELDSYISYIRYLCLDDSKESDNVFHTDYIFIKELLIKFIFDDIIPNLKTKKISVISSFYRTHEIILNSNFIRNKYTYKGKKDLLSIAKDFFHDDEMGFRDTIMKYSNHMDDKNEEYMKYFIKKIEPNLRSLKY